MTTTSDDFSRSLVSWLGMVRRCLDPNNAGYKNYGGRGITICERWYDWRNFYADMGGRPNGLSLDRIDNDKGYAPENCRWATRVEQMRNTRCNVFREVRGVRMVQAEAAMVLCVSAPTVLRRARAGKPIDQKRLSGKLTEAQQKVVRARVANGEPLKPIARDFAITVQAAGRYRVTTR